MTKTLSFVLAVVMGGLAGGAAWAATELAKVNGKALTDQDLKAALSNYNEGQRDAVMKDLATRKQVLAGVIEQELLFQKGEKDKLDEGADYKEALGQFRRQYIVSKLLQKNLGSKINDKAAKEYYSKNKGSRYNTDQVHAMHILVDSEDKAKDLIKKAKEPGADFAALAEENSKDPSAKSNRGDLGFFSRDRMVPEFTRAAFGAGKGDIVGPVQTSFGYHVIKVIDRKAGKALEYDEVEMRVKADLQNELVQEYIKELKKGAKVEINDKNLSKL